jgi:hypothetical protein
MSSRAAAWLLGGWAIATLVACLAVHRRFALDVDDAHPRAVIASVWQGGRLAARAVVERVGDRHPEVDAAATAAGPGATLVYESVVADGPVLDASEITLALSFVPGRDGLAATVDGRTTYLTPDDLLGMQAYDRGISFPSMQFAAGLDVPLALARAAEGLGVGVHDLLDRGRLRRIRVTRTVAGAQRSRMPTPDDLSPSDARDGAVAMARHLARGVDGDGRFRYLVNAPTNQTLPGYDWPRHAGATYFVALVAALTGDADLRFAALRAASLLRDRAMVRCGEHRCIADPDAAVADVGSTALAVLAFVEIVRARLDEGYALLLPELTAFLRGQQREDGDLMHLYDRPASHPIDVQYLYYSGEAAFALSRAHGLSGDPRDLDAATRILARLAGPAWSFFGSRYYWGEEHWTCQAMDDLWGRAPGAILERALDFCLGWQRYGGKLMYGPGETPFDADGAYGVGPILAPHLTPAGSRAEAGVATLEAARRAGRPAAELFDLERNLRRSLSMLLRHQMGRDRTYLLADPAAAEGAMPGSEVDWQLRIDYAQHTGCALLRWLAQAPNG